MRSSVPRWALIPAAIGLVVVGLPVVGLLVRVPWTRLIPLLTSPDAVAALSLSLRTCLASLVLSLLLGVPLAVVITRGRGRWVAPVRTIATLPMVMPPVVAGMALLVTLGRTGLIGAPLRLAGVEIGFTTAAVVIAQTFVAMPYLVVSLDGALSALDPGYERVAGTLGASPTRTLFTVTLPMLRPALLGGAAMTFARALGEFGATLTFAGSLPGVTQTLPQAIYLAREDDPDAALALALVLIVLACLLTGLASLASRPRDREAA